jgi:uncharacterized protein (UPF0332 family)
MLFSRNLILTAKDTLPKGRGAPRQTNLRRAISTCYYAVFHLITDLGCKQVFARNDVDSFKYATRSIEHGDFKSFSKAISKYKTKRSEFNHSNISRLIPLPSDDIIEFSEIVVFLQTERHKADYDLTYVTTKHDVQSIIAKAEKALTIWGDMLKTNPNEPSNLHWR